MDIHLSTIGCRLNEAELENWASDFRTLGHRIVNDAESADLMIFNTCAVTAEAVRKSRQNISRLHRRNPSSRLVVSGCYVSLDQQQASELMGVDLVVENRDKDRLAQITKEILDLPVMPEMATEPAEPALFTRNRQRAFIKIQDGCRYRCTFCIVTVARGEERSRALADIIEEINRHVESGIREIVLTGVHVGGYGSDIGSNLHSLVQSIISETDIERIRFASVEPWDLPDSFFSLFESPRLMPHMHLPLQSGSDAILRKMARRCKTGDFRKLLAHIRESVPGFQVSTDIIVGFPGETEADWRQTLEFVREMRFSHTHVFSYSPRAGTKAAGLPDPVDKNTRKQRSQAMHKLAAEMKAEALNQNLNREHHVLWESAQASDDSCRVTYGGYTENYLRVETTVEKDILLENCISNFRPEKISDNGQILIGRV